MPLPLRCSSHTKHVQHIHLSHSPCRRPLAHAPASRLAAAQVRSDATHSPSALVAKKGASSAQTMRGYVRRVHTANRTSALLPKTKSDVRARSTTSEDAQADTEGDKKGVMVGRLLLVAVAASYGSLTVALRYVFLSAGPPLPSALSFVRSILVALCFVPILAKGTAVQRSPSEKSTPPAFWRAAFELAIWNFLSQGLQNAGCAFTDAGRASFLTQTAIVFTPVIAAFRGDSMPPLTLPAVLCAFLGVVLLACGGSSAAGGLSLSLNLGDILCLLGSASYSLYIVRTADYGRQALQMTGIQAWKSLWLIALYFGWVVVAYMQLPAGAGLVALWPGVAILSSWIALAYSAALPGAGADVMQAIGQSRVNATEAQVLLSLEPLFAAVLGICLLGETMTALACVGSGLIVASVLLASGALDGYLPSKSGSKASS